MVKGLTESDVISTNRPNQILRSWHSYWLHRNVRQWNGVR